MPIYGLSYHKVIQTGYFISPIPLQPREQVVAVIDQGQILARVVSGPHKDLPDVNAEALPYILRAAVPGDLERDRLNTEVGREAGAFWKERVRERELEMKLVDVEVFLDRSKIIFYFTSMSRIDFRELVKDLVQKYRVRIEFRQIGVRHETQLVGAVGNCGMVCCCRRFLHQFAPVTIRMVKEQNLYLNPSKVSGMCGRLLCCLAYEQESYEKFHNSSPRLNKRYVTSKGTFKVIRSNMFHNTVTGVNESGEEIKFSLEEWNAISPRRLDAQATGQNRESGQGHKEEEEGEGEQRREQNQDGRVRGKRQTFVTGRLSFRQQTCRPQDSARQNGGETKADSRTRSRDKADKADRRSPPSVREGGKRGKNSAQAAPAKPVLEQTQKRVHRCGQKTSEGRTGKAQQ